MLFRCEQQGFWIFYPAGRSLVFAFAIKVAEVFAGLFGKSEEALDHIGIFISYVILFGDIVVEIIQLERAVGNRFPPISFFLL